MIRYDLNVEKDVKHQGPVVQRVVSLTSSLRVVSLTVLVDSKYNILIFVAEKSYSHFFSKTFQHICLLLHVNFNKSLTNDVVSFEQLGPGHFLISGLSVDWLQSPVAKYFSHNPVW